MSLNTHSLNSKYDELNIFITIITHSTKITVLSFQETWLLDECTIYIYTKDGYTMFNSICK